MSQPRPVRATKPAIPTRASTGASVPLEVARAEIEAARLALEVAERARDAVFEGSRPAQHALGMVRSAVRVIVSPNATGDDRALAGAVIARANEMFSSVGLEASLGMVLAQLRLVMARARLNDSTI